MTDPQTRVVATPSLVTYYLLKEIGNYLPNVNAIFTPSLDYQDGLRAFRTANQKKQVIDPTALPLLLFNRSTINNNDIYAGRSGHTLLAKKYRSENPLNPHQCQTAVDKYPVLFGDMTFKFMYITSSMEELERFEMLYSVAGGLREISAVSVDIPDIGQIEYKLTWKALQDFTVDVGDSATKSIGAEVIVRGPFIVSKNETLALITNIFASEGVNLHLLCESKAQPAND
ncbi:hypothetical protein [Pseudoalteromonas sp. PS5]|uniref:hypothetical protein n=1 Tax=Pseudoalteromonas sp. PS5 TaxID=1437473 RepID=UPI000FFEA3BE|nr:hypothetical protein [Pseudoalteromonas sp. PS5]RXF04087.1 hypothetical protein D9603_06840 [Pseudoalteromonas sp. PS5]